MFVGSQTVPDIAGIECANAVREVAASFINVMFAHLLPSADRGNDLLSCDSKGNLYAANADSLRCFTAKQSLQSSRVKCSFAF